MWAASLHTDDVDQIVEKTAGEHMRKAKRGSLVHVQRAGLLIQAAARFRKQTLCWIALQRMDTDTLTTSYPSAAVLQLFTLFSRSNR
jgi:hypothetical protein